MALILLVSSFVVILLTQGWETKQPEDTIVEVILQGAAKLLQTLLKTVKDTQDKDTQNE